MRLIFAGTPPFAAAALNALADAGHDLALVLTQPDRPAGRGMKLTPSAVKQAALARGLPVYQPPSLKSPEAQATLRAVDADVMVVAAYGLILPQAVLDLPRLGCLNIHASLLPRWRGAAPIQRAVMAGDAESGVCVMKMEAGLDTGPVGMVERLEIGPDMTSGELHDRLALLGADLMVRALAALGRGALRFTPQPEEGVTYAAKIGNAEAKLNWARPARQVHNLVRGLAPFPGAFAQIDLGKGPERLKVLRTALAGGAAEPGMLLDDEGTVACAEGAVKLLQVQRAGGRPVSGAEFLRGARLAAGSKL